MKVVVLGGRTIPRGSEAFVLLDAPRGESAWAELGVSASGAFLHAMPEAPVDFVARARAMTGAVCVATTDGKGAEPRGAALRTAIIERVLPALERHFVAMRDDEEDFSPWLLTTIVAHVISARIDLALLDALLRAITESAGRGDATSTSQNLTAAGNLIAYARKIDADAADEVVAHHPALAALRLLDDRRLWPADEAAIAPALLAAGAVLGGRRSRALAQVLARQTQPASPTVAAALRELSQSTRS